MGAYRSDITRDISQTTFAAPIARCRPPPTVTGLLLCLLGGTALLLVVLGCPWQL